jgi:tetratricopeptide (TPR) repeat protein
LIAIAAILGVFATYTVYRNRQTEGYSPGEDHEDITRRLDRGIPDGAPEPEFTDVTGAAGLGAFRSFSGERSSQLPEDMGPGAAWGDYDNDGDDDLFLVSAGGPIGSVEAERAPSQLYNNRGDGTFELVTDFPDTRIIGMAAAFGDYNRDGRLDLVVSGYNELRLFRNSGEIFVLDESIQARDGFWAGVSWSDFDLDGDLDLYVCGYVQYVPDDSGSKRTSKQYGRDIPYTLNPASYPPEENLLFRNDREHGFTEVAESLGIHNPEGRSLAALWHDLDDDGRPDLYLANDISDNALYMNKQEGMLDTSHASWVADYRGAMGLAFGDWNRDGDEDIFVTHWIAQENALYDSRLVDDGAPLRFVDVADQRGLGQIALRSVGWGTEFVDFDSDGWQDLVVANGSTFESGEEPYGLVPQPMFLLWNDIGTTFHNLAALSDVLRQPHVSRGLAVSDFDHDGDVDLLFVDSGEGVRLLRNDIEQGNWLQLQLLASGPDMETFLPADGARLTAHGQGVVWRRAVTGASYLSQSSRIVHLGLGQLTMLDRLVVFWPDGSESTYLNLEANRRLILKQGVADPEPAGVASGEPSRESIQAFWVHQRRAIQALKVEDDCTTAISEFRAALALNPTHEDSIYYLGNCLAETGNTDEALQQFAELKRLNPQSHRAYKRWGTLLALESTGKAELERARESLSTAFEINPEATGAITLLAEVDLILGLHAAALERLEQVLRTNPSADYSRFLQAYIVWKAGDTTKAESLLVHAAESKEEWLPEGAVAEGDVKKSMHTEPRLLANGYLRWKPGDTLPQAFAALEDQIEERRGGV